MNSLRFRKFLPLALAALTLAGVLVVLSGSAPVAPPQPQQPDQTAQPSERSGPTGKVKQIGPGLKNCPPKYFCVWQGTNFKGKGVAFEGNADHWHHLPKHLRFIDDTASSAFNHGSGANASVVVYEDVYFKGHNYCFDNGKGSPNLTSENLGNRISSHRWREGCQ